MIRHSTTLLICIAIATASIAACELFAAEGILLAEAPPTGAEGSKYFYQQAEAYEIHRTAEKKPLTLIESPLLNWTNPARTNEQGVLVVWLKQGRPEALGTLFTYQVGTRVYEKHELLSLSAQPLTATFRGREVWSPLKPGFQHVELGEMAPPSANERIRSLQMRRIARQFTGTMIQQGGNTTTLRPLPQPLYRYEKTTGDLIDGAIFSLNVGTDPEVLIIVEARETSAESKWTCALARLHFNELKVERGREQVWHAEPAYELMNDLTGQQKYMEAPYFTYYPESLTPAGNPTP